VCLVLIPSISDKFCFFCQRSFSSSSPDILEVVHDQVSADGSHLSDFQTPNEKEEPPPPLENEHENQNHHILEEAIHLLAEEQQEEELEGQEEEVEIEEDEEEEINIIEDSDNEVELRAPKVNRELKSLGIVPKSTIPREVQKLNTYYNAAYRAHVNLTKSSDPGEPKTMKEALLGPEKELWKESINKEISTFMSRGV
jgi:hypothetical protein